MRFAIWRADSRGQRNELSPSPPQGKESQVIRIHTLSLSALTLVGALATPALAGDFVGPPDWRAMDIQSPNPARKVQQWHLSGAPALSLTYIDDASQPFDDAVSIIEKNFSTNNIRPSVDKDISCRGLKAHLVEFETGPDESKLVIHRLIVPNGAGVSTITYTRVSNTDFDPEVKKSEADYCTATVSSAPAAKSAPAAAPAAPVPAPSAT